MGLHQPAACVPSEMLHSSLLYSYPKCRQATQSNSETNITIFWISKFWGKSVSWMPNTPTDTAKQRVFSNFLPNTHIYRAIWHCFRHLINCIQSTRASTWTVLRLYNVWAPMLQRNAFQLIFYPVFNLKPKVLQNKQKGLYFLLPNIDLIQSKYRDMFCTTPPLMT